MSEIGQRQLKLTEKERESDKNEKTVEGEDHMGDFVKEERDWMTEEDIDINLSVEVDLLFGFPFVWMRILHHIEIRSNLKQPWATVKTIFYFVLWWFTKENVNFQSV